MVFPVSGNLEENWALFERKQAEPDVCTANDLQDLTLMHDSCLKPWGPNFSWLEKKVYRLFCLYVQGDS